MRNKAFLTKPCSFCMSNLTTKLCDEYGKFDINCDLENNFTQDHSVTTHKLN